MFINFAAAFDSVSHKYLDNTLENAGVNRKTRVTFRTIYSVTQGAAYVQSVDDKVLNVKEL